SGTRSRSLVIKYENRDEAVNTSTTLRRIPLPHRSRVTFGNLYISSLPEKHEALFAPYQKR
ncbi:MAG: hypothetical protein OER92_01375, partial [Alphaproteobacteria bacterium]|nr:hypothetical protein [Alphaproteobacteria bacterium]